MVRKPKSLLIVDTLDYNYNFLKLFQAIIASSDTTILAKLVFNILVCNQCDTVYLEIVSLFPIITHSFSSKSRSLTYFLNQYDIHFFCFVLHPHHSQTFLYETSTFKWELSIIIFQTIIDLVRVEFASRGNKTSERNILFWSCGLSLPTIVGYAFCLRLQSYV
jgi:hypothetical protein